MSGPARPITRPITRAVTRPIPGFGAEDEGDFSAVGAVFADPNITITATTSVDLTSGRFGAAISVNGAAAVWYDGAGAASSQSLVVSLTDIGAAAGSLICIDIGYSLTDPATTKVYASATSQWITPSITTPTISDTTPTVNDVLTGTNGTALAQYTNATSTGATRSVEWFADAVSTGDTDTSYTVVSGDVGKVLNFRNTSTHSSGTVNVDSADTSAVVSAANGIGLEGSTDEILMEDGFMVLVESGAETDISAMTGASDLGGTEDLLGVQGGNSRRITPSQIKTYVNA